MNNPEINVAIGLVMMYLSLSLLCTVIIEFIATCFSLRANTLEQALKQLLDDSTLRQNFYKHGMIKTANAISRTKHVSYIPSRTFAMALLGSLNPGNPALTMDDIKECVSKLRTSNIRDSLIAQVAAAEDNIETLRHGLAVWFDQSMDNLGGLYKRKIKWLFLFTGLMLVTAFNADTLDVAKMLWRNDTLRTQIVESASKTLANFPITPNKTSDSITDYMKIFDKTEDLIRPLPLGWDTTHLEGSYRFWLLKMIGLLLTAFALSVGAPFWFDILSKFINVRGGTNKPTREDA